MRILLAEDERSLSNALVTILEHNKYSVDAVYDGVEALSYLDHGNYDGIILDLMMPKKDGLEVLKTLRASKDTTPVLILSAKSGIDDKVTGLDLGADDYLTKPFDPKELLARVRALTRVRTENTDSVITIGNTSLNTSIFMLSTPTDSISLSNKEYQVLELLMSNASRVISTEDIFEKIWGYDALTEISIVWVNISYIRKKLHKLNSNLIIKPSRNLGYSIEVNED